MSLTRKIRKQYNPLFVGCYELRKLMDELIEKAPYASKPKDGIAVFIMASTHKSFSAILALSKMGFAEDAEKICRTMYDGYVHLATILKDETDNMAMQYLSFDVVTRAKMYKSLMENKKFPDYFAERTKNPKQNDESIENIIASAEEWREKYHKNGWNNWQGTQARVQATNVGMEHYFRTAYELQSHLIHVLPRVMNRYLVEKKGEIVFNHLPSENEIEMPLTGSFNIAFNVAEKFNNHFELVDENIFKEMADNWGKVVDQFNK